MQKILLITLTLLGLNSFAQSFPGEMPDLLLNKIVMPIAKEKDFQRFGYNNFIQKFDKKRKTYNRFRNVPLSSDGIKSDYEKLVGKEFKVIGIYKPENTYSSDDEFILELENNEIGIIFYKYDKRFETSYELETKTPLNFPEDYFCKQMWYKKDKFNGMENFYTPLERNLNLGKVIIDGNTNIVLGISVYGSTLNVNETGAFILLKDGKKILRDKQKLDVEASSSGWIYKASIILTEEDIQLLRNSEITDVKLYIYDSEISKKEGYLLQEYLKCMTKDLTDLKDQMKSF